MGEDRYRGLRSTPMAVVSDSDDRAYLDAALALERGRAGRTREGMRLDVTPRGGNAGADDAKLRAVPTGRRKPEPLGGMRHALSVRSRIIIVTRFPRIQALRRGSGAGIHIAHGVESGVFTERSDSGLSKSFIVLLSVPRGRIKRSVV